jgi:hypothetical protein
MTVYIILSTCYDELILNLTNYLLLVYVTIIKGMSNNNHIEGNYMKTIY